MLAPLLAPLFARRARVLAMALALANVTTLDMLSTASTIAAGILHKLFHKLCLGRLGRLLLLLDRLDRLLHRLGKLLQDELDRLLLDGLRSLLARLDGAKSARPTRLRALRATDRVRAALLAPLFTRRTVRLAVTLALAGMIAVRVLPVAFRATGSVDELDHTAIANGLPTTRALALT